MYAYCLFCQTQRCKTIASLLEIRGAASRAFSPQIIRRQRIRGENIEKKQDLLPGYVFFFTESELKEFNVFRGIDGIIRRIGDAQEHWHLTGGDYDFAMNLYQKDGMIGQVTLFKEGDVVRLADPLFNACEGRITQIDLRKQRARVDYTFAGMNCFTWIACDMIEEYSRTS